MKNIFQFSIILFFLFLATVKEAEAYLDPGTGSYIIQVILGGIAAFLLGGKTFLRKVKTLFVRKKIDSNEKKDN